MNELNVEKANIIVAYALEDIAKVLQKYGREGEPIVSAFRRMTAEAIKGVKLTKASLKWVRERTAQNQEKRMAARAATHQKTLDRRKRRRERILEKLSK